MVNMEKIKYLAGSALKLDYDLGQKVFDLVRESSRRANEISKTYPDEGLEATFKEYKPERVWGEANLLLEVFFAFDGERLVGTAFLSKKNCDDLPPGTGAYLGGLYVHSEYWKKNVAPTILDKIKDHARKKSIKIIRGDTTIYPQTLKFYEKHGFRLGEEIFWEVLPGVKMKYYKMELALTDAIKK